MIATTRTTSDPIGLARQLNLASSNGYRSRFTFRHIREAAYPVCRVAAFENPDRVIRLRTLRVLCYAERFVASKTLRPYLGCEHGLRRILCSLCGESRKATACIQNGSHRGFEAKDQTSKNQKSDSQDVLTGSHRKARCSLMSEIQPTVFPAATFSRDLIHTNPQDCLPMQNRTSWRESLTHSEMKGCRELFSRR